MIKIQKKDFNLDQEIKILKDKYSNVGAVISFIGFVRDMNNKKDVKYIELEVYEKMAIKELSKINPEQIKIELGSKNYNDSSYDGRWSYSPSINEIINDLVGVTISNDSYAPDSFWEDVLSYNADEIFEYFLYSSPEYKVQKPNQIPKVTKQEIKNVNYWKWDSNPNDYIKFDRFVQAEIETEQEQERVWEERRNKANRLIGFLSYEAP